MLNALKTLLSPALPATETPAAAEAPAATALSKSAVREAWKAAARARQTSAAAHAAYTLLRGRDLHQAFSPITNPQKIVSCGNDPHWGLNRALGELRQRRVETLAPWATLLEGVARDARGRYTGSHPFLDALTQALSRHDKA